MISPRFIEIQALELSLQSAIAIEIEFSNSKETTPLLLLYLVLRSTCLTPLSFRVVSSCLDRRAERSVSKAGENSENIVTITAGSSVRKLKETLENLGLIGGRRACTTRLTLGRTTQVSRNGRRATSNQLCRVPQHTMSDNKALLGEYAGTTAMENIPLIVLSEPAAVEDFVAEVMVQVVLPGGQQPKQITMHVPPSASLMSVKVSTLG